MLRMAAATLIRTVMENEEKDLAKMMCHRVDTADKHYDMGRNAGKVARMSIVTRKLMMGDEVTLEDLRPAGSGKIL